MDRMLMGGILPSEITDSFVLDFMSRPFTKPKTFTFGRMRITGNSWLDVIRNTYEASVYDYAASTIVDSITAFLRASAQYGLIGGPRALSQLRATRIRLINLGRPGVDIAIRIMKDMRKSDVNMQTLLKGSFLQERDVLKALRRMQFAPGFGYYQDKLTALPKNLQAMMDAYASNPVRRQAAALRARKRADAIQNFVPLDDGVRNPEDAVDTLSRTRGDFGIFRPQPDPKFKEIAQRIQQTRARKIGDAYVSLSPEFRYDI